MNLYITSLILMLIIGASLVFYIFIKSGYTKTATLLSISLLLVSTGAYFLWGAPVEQMTLIKQEQRIHIAKDFLKQFKTPEQVIEKMREHLEKDPNSAKGWYLLGRLYVSTNKLESAVSAFKKASMLEPDNLLYQTQYSQLLTKEKQPNSDITVNVRLSKDFLQRVAPTDTVFIYAKAMHGPKMPLAIVRKQVKDLPMTISLNDSMSMLPNATLSQFDTIQLFARVSFSGNAMSQAGDFIGKTKALNKMQLDSPIDIEINTKVVA